MACLVQGRITVLAALSWTKASLLQLGMPFTKPLDITPLNATGNSIGRWRVSRARTASGSATYAISLRLKTVHMLCAFRNSQIATLLSRPHVG